MLVCEPLRHVEVLKMGVHLVVGKHTVATYCRFATPSSIPPTQGTFYPDQGYTYIPRWPLSPQMRAIRSPTIISR